MTKGPRFQVWALAGGVFTAVLLAGLFVGWRANRALRLSKEEVRTEREVRVEMRPYLTRGEREFRARQLPPVFSQFARLNDRLYIAGPTGLAEYDLSGVFLREFLVGRDLPSSPLVAMAAGMLGDATEPELIVASADEGILVFNGRTFRQIHPSDADVRSITAILPVSAGHLLIGTKKRGVLLCDSKQIRELHSTLSHLYVQALAGNDCGSAR
jgi:hypothetical protein